MKIRPSQFVTLFLLAICLLVMSVGSPNAQDADINVAVEAWLNDDDETAIPMLSKLANSGDESAMLLLGQIARRPGELSPFLHSLGRKKRASLWRAKKGLFGETWLKRVKANKKLADALLSIDDADNRSAGVLNLIELHEYGQAIRSLKRVVEFPEYKLFLPAIEGIKFTPQTSFIEWVANTFIGGPSYLKRNSLHEILLVVEGVRRSKAGELRGFWQLANFSMPWMDLSEYEEEIELAHAVLKGNGIDAMGDNAAILRRGMPELEPIRRVCAEVCSGEVDACARTAYQLLGGFYGFLDLQSPLEKTISTNDYISSPRYKADIFRLMDSESAAYRIKNLPNFTNLCAANFAIQAHPSGGKNYTSKYIDAFRSKKSEN